MNLEELQEQVLKLTEENKTLKEDKDGLTTQLEEKNGRITELQEYNQKLFLRVSNNHVEQQTEEVEYSLDDISTLY